MLSQFSKNQTPEVATPQRLAFAPGGYEKGDWERELTQGLLHRVRGER